MAEPFGMHAVKGWESIGCWTHYVALNFDLTNDLDLGFSYIKGIWVGGTLGPTCCNLDSLGPQVAMWHGSARPAFLVAKWQPPLVAHIWQVPPHGNKNIGDTHSNITSNIIHSCLLISQKLVLFPFCHPIKMELTLVVSWNRKHWPGRSRPIFHKLT